MPPRVLVAEDEQIVRQGIRALLEQAGFEVVGEAADGQEAIALAEHLRPDLAVLDLAMPRMNGLIAAREIARVAPGTRVVLLTSHCDEEQVLSALEVGSKGYVLKTQTTVELVQALREVARGNTYLSPGVSQAVVDAYLHRRDLPRTHLTPREKEVLQLIAEGKTTKEIAQILDISAKTAGFHRTRLMEKLDIHETAGLVRYAIRKGHVQP